MPRTPVKPYQTVLHYFKTAPVAEANIVLDLVKMELRARGAEPVSAVLPGQSAGVQTPAPPAQAKPQAKAQAKAPSTPAKAQATPQAKVATPPVKAKNKPGPKPGSKNKKPRQPAQHPAQVSQAGQGVGVEVPESIPDTLPPQLPAEEDQPLQFESELAGTPV